MDCVKTGNLIRTLRMQRQMTQKELAQKLAVSDKAISKWERGLGCPDLTSLNAVAEALQVNVSELLAGEAVAPTNLLGNLRKVRFYVCPVCGNIVTSTGALFLSCCGHQLLPMEVREADAAHTPTLEPVEDETWLTMPHPMTKAHYITFAAWVTTDRVHLMKLYPEQDMALRFKGTRRGDLYLCCSSHGLFRFRF